MSFRIEWRPATLSRFAAEWDQLDWPGQKRVMDALDETDRLLKDRPMGVGESRELPSDRLLVHPPVVLRYVVDEADGVVRIIGAGVVGMPQ